MICQRGTGARRAQSASLRPEALAGRWRALRTVLGRTRARLPSGRTLLSLWVFSCLATAVASSGLRFVEHTAEAAINHVYGGPWEFFVGGGVAAFDCNGDDFPELYFAGGAAPGALYTNASKTGGPARFERLERSDVELANVTGAYPLDADDDGLVDLMLLRVGENVLLRGVGDCRFERVNEAWGFDGGDAWTTAFAAIWEDGREFPTLAVGNYVDRSRPGAPWGTCQENELHRSGGTGYRSPTLLSPGYCALSLRFSDWNRDGTPDLWVSNDRQYYLGGGDRAGSEQLWRLAPDAGPYLYTAADGWEKLQIWGMGIASADLTGDGLPEIYLTSMTDQKLRILVEGASGPTYADAAYARGLTVHRPFTGGDTRPSTGWHAQFEDVDHDTLFDLFVAKGNVEAMPEFAQADPNNLLLGRPDGTFDEVAETAGVLSFERARGALLVDLNLDGRLDLVVVNRGAPVQVWTNQSTDLGHWLMVRLSQPGSNARGIGAWLEIDTGERTVRRELFVGGGHASGAWGFTHVGLGDVGVVDVRVTWPDGMIETWSDVAADGFVELRRGGGVERIAVGGAQP